VLSSLNNRLIIYELTLFRRSFADAFGRTRDKVLLALVVALALLALRGGMPAIPQVREGPIILAAIVALTLFSWHRMVLRRLSWFGEHSPLAPDALCPGSRRSYVTATQLPPLLALALGVLTLASATGIPAAWAASLLGWATGVGAATWLNSLPKSQITVRKSLPPLQSRVRRQQPALFAILRHQLFHVASPVRALLLIVGGTASITIAASILAAGGPAPLRFAAALMPSTALLLLTSRNDGRLIGLLAFAGYSAAATAMAISILPGLSFFAAVVALLIARPSDWPAMVGLLLIVHASAYLVAIARAWLSPGRDGRSVDLQVQLELAALLALIIQILPLAPLALLARLYLLQRRYRSLLWVQL